MKTLKYIIVCITFLSPFYAQSQYKSMGSWNIMNVKFKINEKWSVYTEGQLRSLKFYNNFHYYEYQAGVNYKLSQNMSIALAAGDYNTYKEGGNFVMPMKNNEFRTGLQITLSQPFTNINVEHRYRAEQRFTSNGFRNRFRYRFNTKIPLGKELPISNLYAIINNEIFFTNIAPYFERNRFMCGAGYKFDKHFTLQMGYLHQFDYKITDETGRSFIQVALLFEFDKK